ncbi:transcription/translation regulatory transformer protein RfaH [Methylolobus aquaticus]
MPEPLGAVGPMRWHVVYSKPRQEALALTQLERQGYVCYLPMCTAESLRRGRRSTITEPLFRRYLFIRLSSGLDGSNWGPIRSTLGVSCLVCFGREPACIADALIDQLRRYEQTSGARAEPLHQLGDRVRINEGPYAGLSAVYQMDDGDARARVLIELLQRPAQLTVPLASLMRDVA